MLQLSSGSNIKHVSASGQAATADLGKNYHPYEGAYLSQVNSIQRHVAQDLGIPLIDYETILQQARCCRAAISLCKAPKSLISMRCRKLGSTGRIFCSRTAST